MISALVLSGGMSIRMGFPKLLLRLGDRSVIQRVVDNALASQAGEMVVVLGEAHDRVREELDEGKVKVVVNHHYLLGMSTSLRAGLEAMNPQAEGAIVLLGDQPLVGPDVINAVINKYEETRAPIVAPWSGRRWGNPVLFARSLFAELAAVRGDRGGRQVLARHREEMVLVYPPGDDWWSDLDTWEDYLTLCCRLVVAPEARPWTKS